MVNLSSPRETSTDSELPSPPPAMYMNGTAASMSDTATTATRAPLDHEGSGEPLPRPLNIGAIIMTTPRPIRTSPSTRLLMIRAHAHIRMIVPIAIHFPQRDAISLDSLSFLDLQSTPTLRNLYPLPCIHWHSPMHIIGMQQNAMIATYMTWNVLHPIRNAASVIAAGTATARTA